MLNQTVQASNYQEFRNVSKKLFLLAHPDKTIKVTQNYNEVWPEGDPLTDFMKKAVSYPIMRHDYNKYLIELVEAIGKLIPSAPSVKPILQSMLSYIQNSDCIYG